MDFSRRSYQKELLDGDHIPFEAIQQNMKELDFINRRLGGHSITIAGLKKLISHQQEFSICEIGCGGGDNLLAIKKWCTSKNISVKIIGIDINRDCVAIARKKFSASESEFLVADYKLINFEEKKPDIIFASLFCHHFTDEALNDVLLWMQSHSGKGFFINDLHRNPLAYYSILLLTKLFSASYLVKNDAPLSVLRGFSRKDWKELLLAAGIRNYFLEWKWAFRWLIVINKNT
jgi:2-polyprenyl-3-methyl-5-hydroxy-6-metoxy-1,4-benzoquinol methylase